MLFEYILIMIYVSLPPCSPAWRPNLQLCLCIVTLAWPSLAVSISRSRLLRSYLPRYITSRIIISNNHQRLLSYHQSRQSRQRALQQGRVEHSRCIIKLTFCINPKIHFVINTVSAGGAVVVVSGDPAARNLGQLESVAAIQCPLYRQRENCFPKLCRYQILPTNRIKLKLVCWYCWLVVPFPLFLKICGHIIRYVCHDKLSRIASAVVVGSE